MAYARSRVAARSHSLFLDLPIAVVGVLLTWACLSIYTTPAVQPLASTLTNEPSPVPAPAPTLKRPLVAEAHTAVEQDQTALFQTTAWKKTSVDDAATSATAWKSNFVASASFSTPSTRRRTRVSTVGK